MNLLEMLRMKEGFNENESNISDYILSHCEDIIHLSSRELGRRTYTSSTVVVRFCKKLGYERYSDFKVKFLIDLRSDNEDVHLEKEEHILSIMNKVSTKQQQTVEQMKTMLSLNNMKELHQRLLSATYIDIIAVDVNTPIADYASHSFFSAGKIANTYSSYHMQYMLSMLANAEEHIVFIISKSGVSKELVNVAKELRIQHVYSIALTSDTKSPLSNLCSMSFPCLFQEDFHSLQDMVFMESAIFFFNTIVAMLISYDFDYTTDLKEKYNQEYKKGHA